MDELICPPPEQGVEPPKNPKPDDAGGGKQSDVESTDEPRKEIIEQTVVNFIIQGTSIAEKIVSGLLHIIGAAIMEVILSVIL